MSARRVRKTRTCVSCHRRYAMRWHDEAWVCQFRTCCAEWYEDETGEPMCVTPEAHSEDR